MYGRIITFWRGSLDLVLDNLNFDMAKLWVRVFGLPLIHLDPEWGVQALRHVGCIGCLDNAHEEEALEPDIRVQMMIYLSRPLIHGCFLPTSNGEAVWVYF